MAGDASLNLPELWQQILAGLELPSTRMLLSQQAQLIKLDERRAVVRVAGTWMAMVQSRLPLLEKALTQALGSSRQLQLESGDAPAAAASAPTAAPVAAPVVVAPPQAKPAPATPARSAAASQPPPQESAPRGVSAPPQAVAAAVPPAAPNDRPQTAAAPALPQPNNGLDAKAQRLAEFFNGEVVPFEGELEVSDGSAGQQDVA
jgi:DNA polymerase-3 subunit gamma/tau